MAEQVLPYTWVVRFDVAPEWVADGFTLCDERALEMLSRETMGCMTSELAARVLVAPDPRRVAREQGWPEAGAKVAHEIKQMIAGAPYAHQSRSAGADAPRPLAATLAAAIALLDSVAFVRDERDNTQEVLGQLRQAHALLTGDAPISDIEWQVTPE